MTIDLHLDAGEVALSIDLYQLVMAASFFEHGFNQTACFELSARRMPPGRGYLVAAGQERLLEALEDFHFGPDALAYLGSLNLFSLEFRNYLAALHFTGEVRAMPEGAIFFAGEPMLEVRAPLIEAQLVETLALNQVGFASMAAGKAARCRDAAEERRLIDFGLRRADGVDAGLIAARASYLAGFHGSSNVLAGQRYGVPLFGTMSHSYVMAHEREREAFENFTASFPQLGTLLVDTYDTARGVENAAVTALKLRASGGKLQAVRLDSGNLMQLSRLARNALDRHGLNDVAIFASGDLDEHAIADLVRAGAPIDAFGVGTALAVSKDAPAGDWTYKLVDYRGRPRLKTSQGKPSIPGRKQVFRGFGPRGEFLADMVGLIEEGPISIAREIARPAPFEVVPLLSPQMENGRRRMPRPELPSLRENFLNSLPRLERRYRALKEPAIYPVRQSAALNSMVISERVRAEARQD